MEKLGEILARLQEQVLRRKTICPAIKTGELSFPEEQLKLSYTPIMLAENAEEACAICESLRDCPLHTNGWVPVLDLEASGCYGYPYFKWRKCYRRKTYEAIKQAEASLGAKFSERSFDTFEVTEENRAAYEACREYALELDKSTKLGLMLFGPVGTGKTHLAAAILKVAFGKGLSGAWVSVPQLLSEIRKGFNEGQGRELAEKIARKFLVVLDDLGAERTTDWVQEELYLLINMRYEHELPTIVTTNCTGQELAEKIGLRAADRLREMCKPVLVSGPSRRAEKRKEMEELGIEMPLAQVPVEWLEGR